MVSWDLTYLAKRESGFRSENPYVLYASFVGHSEPCEVENANPHQSEQREQAFETDATNLRGFCC
jgi:hypothetical protein